MERNEGPLSIPNTPKPGQGQSEVSGFISAPDTKPLSLGALLPTAGLAAVPQDPVGSLDRALLLPLQRAARRPRFLSSSSASGPLFHLLVLSPGKGRTNPFWGTFSTFTAHAQMEQEKQSQLTAVQPAICQGAERAGQPWPRTFSTRAQQAPFSQASSNARESWDANQGGLIRACPS